MFMLTGVVEVCQRVLYSVSNCTVFTFGKAASVEASDASTACTLNEKSGAEERFALKAIDSLSELLVMLMAVRPITPTAILSTTRMVRRRRRVTSAMDLRVNA